MVLLLAAMKAITVVLLLFCVWAVAFVRSLTGAEEAEKTEEELAREEEYKRENFGFVSNH